MAQDLTLPVRRLPLVRWPYGLMLPALALFEAFLWWQGQPWYGLIWTPIMVISVWLLIRPPELVLTAKGFFYGRKGFWEPAFFRWIDIQELFLAAERVGLQEMRGAIGWTFRPEARRKGPVGFLLRGMGLDGVIQWTRAPAAEVLALMETYRAAALAEADRTLP
ncbi:hypothetical protein [Brevundimonas goettingensis]|uniref:PH domain-containing protein n=1 Tax=Brevundimonas goettingensis TaxID=2774190 RepID=A0A975C105_9CAUL|nr:hypothetical protein [Brevundimonas goettingensis]QTC91893.1 hypothetical protein IFJ75_02900 [Brevundimonas goettingensis]